MDGHQLQAAIGLRIGGGKQAFHVVFQRIDGKTSGGIQRIQPVEKCLHIQQLAGMRQALRPTEFFPDIFNPDAAALTPLPGQRFSHHRTQMAETLLPIGAQTH